VVHNENIYIENDHCSSYNIKNIQQRKNEDGLGLRFQKRSIDFNNGGKFDQSKYGRQRKYSKMQESAYEVSCSHITSQENSLTRFTGKGASSGFGILNQTGNLKSNLKKQGQEESNYGQ